VKSIDTNRAALADAIVKHAEAIRARDELKNHISGAQLRCGDTQEDLEEFNGLDNTIASAAADALASGEGMKLPHHIIAMEQKRETLLAGIALTELGITRLKARLEAANGDIKVLHERIVIATYAIVGEHGNRLAANVEYFEHQAAVARMRLSTLAKTGTGLSSKAQYTLNHPNPEGDIILNTPMYFFQGKQFTAWAAWRAALAADPSAKPHIVDEDEPAATKAA